MYIFDNVLLEDIIHGAIRSRKLKKDRQYNDQSKKEKMTYNDLQHITYKSKDTATLAQLKATA
jgi:hypothetical protein